MINVDNDRETIDDFTDKDIESTGRNENIITKRNHRKKKQKKESNHEKTVVAILGDSIVKDVNGWDLSSDERKVVVKSFSGATKKCM